LTLSHSSLVTPAWREDARKKADADVAAVRTRDREDQVAASPVERALDLVLSEEPILRALRGTREVGGIEDDFGDR
jgi:hypothetical protein